MVISVCSRLVSFSFLSSFFILLFPIFLYPCSFTTHFSILKQLKFLQPFFVGTSEWFQSCLRPFPTIARTLKRPQGHLFGNVAEIHAMRLRGSTTASRLVRKARLNAATFSKRKLARSFAKHFHARNNFRSLC